MYFTAKFAPKCTPGVAEFYENFNVRIFGFCVSQSVTITTFCVSVTISTVLV